jgi:hypothetical protein
VKQRKGIILTAALGAIVGCLWQADKDARGVSFAEIEKFA